MGGEMKGMVKRRLLWLFVALAVATVLLAISRYVMVDQDWLEGMGQLRNHQVRIKALRSLVEMNAWHEEALEAGFSKGYVLFAADDVGNLVPGEPQALPLGIDWSRARIVQVTRREVSLVPPALFFEADQCVRVGRILTFQKGRRDRIHLCRLGGKGVSVILLSGGRKGMVFCLGIAGG